MTNYEKICAYINAWHYAVAEAKNKIIRVFTLISSDDYVRYWRSNNTLGEAVGRAWDDIMHRETINDMSFTRIYPLPRPIPKYKVGDKVVVLENTKELLRNTSIVAGGIYTVSAVNSNGTIHLDNCIVSFLPHCVAPYFDDDIEEMTVEQICKALGKNIKIVK